MGIDEGLLVREEPMRIKRFRLMLVNSIPRFPNNRETLAQLEEKSLASLFIVYLNWVARLIPPRPRRVVIEPTLTADPRWKRLAADTKALLKKASGGFDLAPHLSVSAVRSGYTPAASVVGANTNKWEDKDFLLTVMGYHHLHLSPTVDSDGFTRRTNEVLFAQLTRTTFNAVGFFDHSVFGMANSTTQGMNDERNRLWELYDRRNSFGRRPGVYISNPIMTSGHLLHHVTLARRLSNIVYELDAKLDDLRARAGVFPKLPYSELKAMKLVWRTDYMDLGLLDKTSSKFYVLRHGPL